VLAPHGCFCIALLHPLNRPDAARRDYFREHRVAEPIEREGVPMVFEDAHRPLSAYTSPLTEAGFVIEAIGEPSFEELPGEPVAGAVRNEPYFLHLRCRLAS
jgi:hypothetical protein